MLELQLHPLIADKIFYKLPERKLLVWLLVCSTDWTQEYTSLLLLQQHIQGMSYE